MEIVRNTWKTTDRESQPLSTHEIYNQTRGVISVAKKLFAAAKTKLNHRSSKYTTGLA